MQSALQSHRAYQARGQLALLKITPSPSRSEATSPTVRLRRCRLRRTPDRCPQNDVSCVSSVPSSTVLGQTFEVSMRECLCVSVVYVFHCAVHRNRISTSDIAFCDTTTTATPLGLQRLRFQCCRVDSVVQCCSSDCKKKLVGIRTELGYIHIYIRLGQHCRRIWFPVSACLFPRAVLVAQISAFTFLVYSRSNAYMYTAFF